MQTNTFQCVLATNGTVSYAMFLYVDGHMQWTAYDTDTKGQATMGFESEKRSNTFYTSDADKDHVNDIDLTSNSGTPGLWIFMDDGLQILQPTTGIYYMQYKSLMCFISLLCFYSSACPKLHPRVY